MGCIRGFREKVSCMEPRMRPRPDAGLTWTRAPPAGHAPEAPVEVRPAAFAKLIAQRDGSSSAQSQQTGPDRLAFGGHDGRRPARKCPETALRPRLRSRDPRIDRPKASDEVTPRNWLPELGSNQRPTD